MIFKSLVGKVWLFLAAWVFIILIVFGLILAWATHNFYYGYAAEENQELMDTAHSLANYFALPDGPENAPQHLAFLGNLLKYDLIITNRDGKVLVATSRNKNWLVTVMSRQDMASILQGRNITHTGNSPYLPYEIVEAATPIRANGHIIGGAFVVEPLNSLERIGSEVIKSIGWGLGLSFLLVLPIGFFIARRITFPVLEMDRAARNLARGNYNTRLQIRSRDELASLSRSINQLSGAMQSNLQAMAQEHQQLTNILASIEDGVISLTRHGEVVLYNEAAARHLGLEPDQPIQQADLPKPLQDAINRARESQHSEQGEFAVDGHIYDVEAAPIYVNSEYTGLVLIWHDVTKERELEHMRQDLISNISHELRTPLSYLQGYSEALLDGTVEEETARQHYQEIILRETLRLRGLVNDLLDLSRLESATLELPREPVEVAVCLAELRQRLAPQLEQSQVELPLAIDPNLPAVEASFNRVLQILLNLVDNALRFTPPGGQITVDCRPAGNYVRTTVTDNGPGIPTAELPLVWHRFYRVKGSKSQASGSGLGLAIVKNLVEAYGGQVGVESSPGRGTAFYFTLPIARKTDFA